MTTAQQTKCPPADQLAQLVSGSLGEPVADRLFNHIDECSACQQRMDDLSRRADPVLAAARENAADQGSSEDAGLSRLIQLAQRQAAADDTRNNRSTATTVQPVSAGEFVDGLRRSGLLPDQELDQVLTDLSWDETKSSGDGSTIAKALIHQQKLTPFQARLLLRGRWKGLVLGNYAILEKLGQGGMGSVFKARHTRMGRIVCLKVVNSAGRQSQAVIDRFRNEARALAALSHPNIIVAHDADENKGVPFLVMEYIDGDDLAKQVRKEGTLPATETLQIAIETAKALQYAHDQGVIHRDIKPHNLVTTRNATGKIFVKVLDLGLARFDTLLTDNPDASILAAMTNTGVVIGTVDYMAPEQALDSRNADARSDIYSLGCTMFFLLTGRSPFEGDTVMQRLVAHREQPAPALWELAEDATLEFEAVVHKMLAKNPEDRYQSMNEVLADFDALTEGTKPSAAASMQATRAAAAQPLVSQLAPPAETIAAPLDIDFDNEQSPVERPKPKKKRRTKLIAGNGLTAIALLAIAAISVAAVPLMKLINPPRVGAQRALRNGGEGRALVVVGSENFNKDEFTQLAAFLESRQVDLVAASANYGTEREDKYGEIKGSYENINLADAKGSDFDAVFVLGGDCTDLTYKKPIAHKEVSRLVESALQSNIDLTGCSNGWNVIHDTGIIKKHEYKQAPRHQVQDATQLVSKASEIFGKLKPEK